MGRSVSARSGDGHDPVRARRARAERLAAAGKTLGYGCIAVAIVAFLVGAVTDFSPVVVTVVVTALAAGSVVLAPGIIIGYGVKAAEREDRRAERG